eukprot:COSAG05_NODE_1363_length_5081_cov_1.577479_7_plen_123_part_00
MRLLLLLLLMMMIENVQYDHNLPSRQKIYMVDTGKQKTPTAAEEDRQQEGGQSAPLRLFLGRWSATGAASLGFRQGARVLLQVPLYLSWMPLGCVWVSVATNLPCIHDCSHDATGLFHMYIW